MSLDTERLWSQVLAARSAQIRAQKAFQDAVDTYRREMEKEVQRLKKLGVDPGPNFDMMQSLDIATGGTGI